MKKLNQKKLIKYFKKTSRFGQTKPSRNWQKTRKKTESNRAKLEKPIQTEIPSQIEKTEPKPEKRAKTEKTKPK